MSFRVDHNAFSLAICDAAGIPREVAERSIAVVYEHEVGRVPTITLTHHVIDPDADKLTTRTTFKAEAP